MFKKYSEYLRYGLQGIALAAIVASSVIFSGCFGGGASDGGSPDNREASWSDLDLSISNTTFSMNSVVCESSDNIYVGGSYQFSLGGAKFASDIAMWDGSSWGSTPYPGTNATIFAIGRDSADNIYVGGQFYRVGGNITAWGVAKWDGSSWSALGEGKGTDDTSKFVGAIACDSAGNVYAAGWFSYANDNGTITNIAKWNGSS